MGSVDEYYDKELTELTDLENRLKEIINNNRKDVKIPMTIGLPIFVLDVREARWVSSRLYEDVERGIFSTQIIVKKSPNSIELDATIRIGENVGYAVVSGAVMYLLKELKEYLLRNKRRKEKLDKERKRF